MKLSLRLFAAALVLTGAVASAHIKTSDVAPQPTRMSSLPMPTCPPDDPNGCGM